MATLVARAYHPINGTAESVWEGFSWPCLLFGCFWYLYKHMWNWAVISFILAVSTFGISWIVFAFFANEQYARSLRKQGYLSESEWEEHKQGRSQRGRPPTTVRQKQSSVAEELMKLADLRDRGLLTEEEFEQQKARILS